MIRSWERRERTPGPSAGQEDGSELEALAGNYQVTRDMQIHRYVFVVICTSRYIGTEEEEWKALVRGLAATSVARSMKKAKRSKGIQPTLTIE